jgi:hypothetical protein
MKNLSIYFVILTGALSVLTSCQEDDSLGSVNADPQPVINAAASGTWRITYFFDTDSEETNNFTNYDFTFGSGNVLTATNGTNTYTGSWSVTNDSSNSNDDSNDDSNDLDFNIAFGSPANFAELSDDWDIISYSANKIELIDVSGGNGGTDYLTFEKVQ